MKCALSADTNIITLFEAFENWYSFPRLTSKTLGKNTAPSRGINSYNK